MAAAGIAAVIGGFALVRMPRRGPAPGKGLVYSPGGYGGFVAPPAGAATGPAAPSDPMVPVEADYNAGRYLAAERRAGPLIARAASSGDPSARRAGARARLLTAFSAARQKDLATARERFEIARREAASLPDHGAVAGAAGRRAPTLEESAAYQHAVCTAALGDTRAAESEWVAFMSAHPESPLVHASVRRIGRLHGGDIPPEAVATWRQAMAEAARRDRARSRERSLCAPECLAELLRRRGRPADARSLAREMGTDHTGTSLADLCAAARKRGLAGAGLALTQKGLERQRLPLVALLAPGHFVIAERIGPAGVEVWDPDGAGLHRPARRLVSTQEWKRSWRGLAMAVGRLVP